jgi:hypothetical protein
MDFQANSSAKMRELLRGTVEHLRNNSPQDYLTKYVRGKAEIEAANSRGFIVVLDYEDLGSFGYMEPDGGSLVTTHKPAFDRITCNYQYVQVGSELTNETLANSKHGRPVGADAKASMIEKAGQKMLDMEEFYFCQGDGNQTFARITANSAAAIITCAGTADGFGAYFIKKGAVVRIYDSTLVTLKGTRTVTAKTANTAFTVNSNITVVIGDLVLPEGDATTPTTTGIKGLPYIMLPSGAYFDKNKTTTSALKPIVDTTSAALSRTKIENLNQRHRIRNGRRQDVGIVTSPTQHSAYFSLFTALTPTANWNGEKRPAADLGLDSWDYTWFGTPIRDFKCVPATAWYHLTFSSLCRVEMGEVGKMITPAGDYVQKVDATLGYLNSQQRWDDAYLEFFSPNPAQNAGLTALTFASLPLLVEDTYV